MNTRIPCGATAAKTKSTDPTKRRPRIDPATREGQIDAHLRQLSNLLERHRTPLDGGLLPIVAMAIRIRDLARKENRIVDWRYVDDTSLGFDRTPVMFLHPAPAKVIEIKPYLERRAAER